MIEARRRAYLEAMGFEVWVAKAAAPHATARVAASVASPAGLIRVGPGQGSTLLVCATAADTAGKFAADVVRALGGDPAWAWPDRADAGGGVALEEAIGARLFTRVFVFGDEAARWLFAGEIPQVIASAAVTVVDSLEVLAVRGAAKQALWRRLQDPLRSPPRGGAAPVSP